MTMTTLSTAEARRLALAAQGFGGPRQVNAPGWRDLRGVVKRLGLLQIDSVNVLVRFRLPTKSTFYRACQLGKYASRVSPLSLLVENLILPKT
jgi:uncharacterized protein YcaQ